MSAKNKVVEGNIKFENLNKIYFYNKINKKERQLKIKDLYDAPEGMMLWEAILNLAKENEVVYVKEN